MQNAQLKKILIITCCLLVGVGVVFVRWYIKSNIDRHSVYYIMNISHGRDAHPEFAMLLDNIDSMEQPEKRKLDISRKVVLLGYLVIDFIFIMELMCLMMRNLF